MVALPRVTLKQQTPAVFYPESDDEPLGETDLHALETRKLADVLIEFFKHDPQVYVAMDNFLYYEEGNPKAVISPDVYVVKGVEKKLRDLYKVWQEGGRVPAVVFEITSKSSKTLDLGKKKNTCAQLGVNEYFLFDPKGEYLEPVLRAFQLKPSGVYEEIIPDQNGDVFSVELQLKFSSRAPGMLRVIDPRNEKVLPRYEELTETLESAEAEIARLKEELRRLKRDLKK